MKLISMMLVSVLLSFSAAYAEDKPDLSSMPFDLSVKVLPKDFRGNNQKELFEKLVSITEKNKKDEFETTQQWEQRKQKSLSQNIYGSIKIDSPIAFVKDNSNATYDFNFVYNADRKSADIEFSVYHRRDELGDNKVERYTLDLDKISSSASPYIGENAYGAKTNATMIISNRIRLIFTDYDDYLPILMTEKYHPVQRIVLNNVDIEKAKSLKTNASLLFIVKLVSPYAAITENHIQATRDFPTGGSLTSSNFIASIMDIWVYDSSTGEVFQKIITDKPKDEDEAPKSKSKSWFRKLF